MAEGGSDGGTGTGPGPGQASPAPATPAAQPTGPPANQPATPPSETPFYAEFSDPELKSWVEAKGWRSPEALAKSTMHLEKMTGAPADQIVRIPQSDDPSALRPVFERLGMPADPKDYEIPSGENAIPEYEGAAREAYHKLGLTKAQVKGLTEFNQEFAKQYGERQNEQFAAQATVQETELKREWGNAFPRQMHIANQAAQQLGFTDEVIGAMENAMGYKETMKFMANLGGKLGEDNFVSGESRPGFNGQMTPDQARQAWAAFSSDPANREALFNKMHPQHDHALKRKAELFQVMHPDE